MLRWSQTDPRAVVVNTLRLKYIYRLGKREETGKEAEGGRCRWEAGCGTAGRDTTFLKRIKMDWWLETLDRLC